MDYFYTQHWLTGFYNRDGVCLMGGEKKETQYLKKIQANLSLE